MRAGWIGSAELASTAPSRSRAARSASRSPCAHSEPADVPVGASRSDNPLSTRGRVPAHRHLHGVGPPVVGGVRQVDHLGRRGRVPEDAIAEPEVEGGTDDDHHVRAPEGR